ncbi:hypothetical protein CCR75_006603 [Bremia lactucae]|uniref:Myb-like DNA-binding protein n=1 Tax=Bremia lactucae TaxID=4779 RepID=A0A976FRJ1_BRELC|nr:hypothetical protein CCR75_006603 [Bremia lactucae]
MNYLHDYNVEARETEPLGNISNNAAFDEPDFSTLPIIELDPKDLLIVKDGVIRVAESLGREQQSIDANRKAVKASGTWTRTEHERFLCAMKTFPTGPWKAIAEMVATRTVRQTQTHAQKYREKLARHMRGLRNRNGTLRIPPSSTILTSELSSYNGPYIDTGSRTFKYTTPSNHNLAFESSRRTIPLARACSMPAMPTYRSICPDPTPYARTPMSASMAMTSPDLGDLTPFMTHDTFLGNASHAFTSEAKDIDTKPSVPNFDESMDFLMDVYSTCPIAAMASQTGVIVTPPACTPRTPQTPISSKRFFQQSQTLFIDTISNANTDRLELINKLFS